MTRRQAVLLVEGRDDAVVCGELLECHAVPETFTLKELSGLQALLAAFPLYLENTAYERVGIVVDADEDIAARWQALRNTLIALGYHDVPNEPDPEGTVLEAPGEDRPRAGVWIMPDNRAAGMLEDFVRFLIPANDLLLPYVETCVNGIPETARRWPDGKRGKAVIHAWLAWQEEPGQPMGTAIKARYLDATLDHGRRLAEWCRRLFL